jgi:hypothetical protein
MEEEWAQMKKHMGVNYSQHDSPGSAVTKAELIEKLAQSFMKKM